MLRLSACYDKRYRLPNDTLNEDVFAKITHSNKSSCPDGMVSLVKLDNSYMKEKSFRG